MVRQRAFLLSPLLCDAFENLPLPASFLVFFLLPNSLRLTLVLPAAAARTCTMAHKVTTYLRTFRRRSGLTQGELAFLLGAHSGAKVSRYERLSRRPNFRTALGLQTVFGVPADQLVPGICAEVDRNIIRRVRLLSRQLERHSDSARTKRKLRFLLSVMARGGAAPQQHVWERDNIASD